MTVGAIPVIGTKNLAWTRGFMLGPYLRIAIGDQIQSAYYLWLWAHSLATFSHPPWVDPFQFAASGYTSRFVVGWPLVLLSVPIDAVAGPIAAFNAVVFAGFVASACATYLLAREIGASRAGSAVAGFAFAFAPYRLMQSGHMNSLLAFLLPLTLFFLERALRSTGPRAARAAWACAGTFVSLVAGGELHLVTYLAALAAGYFVVRSINVGHPLFRSLWKPALGLISGAAMVAGLIYVYVLHPSARVATPAISQAPAYAPHVSDIFSRHLRPVSNPEQYAYPGLVILLLAVAGAVMLFKRRGDRVLVLYLVAVAAGATALAITPSLIRYPLLLDIYKAIPTLRYTRVPGRVLIVSALALAVLAAFAVDAVRNANWARVVTGVALLFLVLDPPHAYYFHYAPAGGNALERVPPGASVLDLPAVGAHHPAASRIELYILKNHGPRAGGYYELATPKIDEALADLLPLNNVNPDPCTWKHVTSAVHVSYVAIHLDLYGPDVVQYQADGHKLVDSLDRMSGFQRVSLIDNVAVFRLDRTHLACR